MDLKYFTLDEFDSPDAPGSGAHEMQPDFLQLLDMARELYGEPIRINSGYRTEAHNKKIGGAPASSHLIGRAADISAPTFIEKAKLLVALYTVGFRRFGIMATAIHVDNDPTKSPAVWHYPNTREKDKFEFSNLSDVELYVRFYTLKKRFNK